MKTEPQEIIVAEQAVGAIIMSRSYLSVEVVSQSAEQTRVKVLASGVETDVAKGTKMFAWSAEHAKDIKTLVEKDGMAERLGIDPRPQEENVDVAAKTATENTEEPLSEATPDAVPPENVEAADAVPSPSTDNQGAPAADLSTDALPQEDVVEDEILEPAVNVAAAVSKEAQKEAVPAEEIPEVTETKEEVVAASSTESVTEQDNKTKQEEEPVMEKTKELGNLKKGSLSSVMLPLLCEKKHTATAIAKKVQEAFPGKYDTAEAFDKLVKDIKGPRLYNAKKVRKLDVALLAE